MYKLTDSELTLAGASRYTHTYYAVSVFIRR